MTYDIFSNYPPQEPSTGRGTEFLKFLTSKASPKMQQPLKPMAFPALSAHIHGVEMKYSDGKYYEIGPGQLAHLIGVSGIGKRELSHLHVVRHQCRCPFHDDRTPSMSFKNGKWKCWSGCGSGDSINLVQRVLGKNFLEACQWLADEHNVILSNLPTAGGLPSFTGGGGGGSSFDASRYERYFERPWLNDEARKFLYEERRIDPRVVRYCRLSSYKDRDGVPWLSIPYFNREGQLIGVQRRNLIKGARPRFKFAMGCAPTIYNLPVLNRLHPGDELYIAEGSSDTWSLLSAARKTVAIPSATLLSQKDAELLQALSHERSIRFMMFPDNDLPGTQLAGELKAVLPNLVIHQLPPECKDVSEYYLSTKRW